MKQYPTPQIEVAIRDAEAAATELGIAMHQAIHGHTPGGVAYDFDACVEAFRAATRYVNEAWDEYHASR